MDEAGRKALGEAGKRYLARLDKFDDRKIGAAWVEMARREPSQQVTTREGLVLIVRRKPVGAFNVAYEAYIGTLRRSRVAWMHCAMPIAGRVQVTNASVYDVRGRDYRRGGIGTAIYDLIERDVRAAGAEGLEPHWGSMSVEAIEFWKKRRPEYANDMAKLNRFGTSSSWLFD